MPKSPRSHLNAMERNLKNSCPLATFSMRMDGWHGCRFHAVDESKPEFGGMGMVNIPKSLNCSTTATVPTYGSKLGFRLPSVLSAVFTDFLLRDGHSHPVFPSRILRLILTYHPTPTRIPSVTEDPISDSDERIASISVASSGVKPARG